MYDQPHPWLFSDPIATRNDAETDMALRARMATGAVGYGAADMALWQAEQLYREVGGGPQAYNEIMQDATWALQAQASIAQQQQQYQAWAAAQSGSATAGQQSETGYYQEFDDTDILLLFD